jgi:hypothetical protein
MVMEKLIIHDNEVANLPGFAGGNARIRECQTPEQLAAWCEAGDSMACRYENRIYIKTPKSLDRSGAFSLDYDCLPLEEANLRIEQWNTHQHD